MPLELGIALSLRYQGKISGTTHNWVALVPPGFVHHQFISDLAGFDSPSHDQTPAGVICAISGWLMSQPDFEPLSPSPRTILDAYPDLVTALETARNEALGVLTWPVIIRNVERVVSTMKIAQV